jgi:hypothetical protein
MLFVERGNGPAGDYRYDWAGWGAPRLLKPLGADLLGHELHEFNQADSCNLRNPWQTEMESVGEREYPMDKRPLLCYSWACLGGGDPWALLTVHRQWR